MALRVACSQVGFDECSFIASGTEGKVMGQLLAHVRQEHAMEIPENIRVQPASILDEPERMVWNRIRRAVSSPRPNADKFA